MFLLGHFVLQGLLCLGGSVRSSSCDLSALRLVLWWHILRHTLMEQLYLVLSRYVEVSFA